MAVQAQYHPSSNVMNLPINSISCNATNLQQGGGGGHHDYSFQQQQQPLGLLLDQTHAPMLYNNNNKASTTTNSLKRGREGTSIGANVINNPYSLQSHSSSHLINLSQLHNHHQNAVSTGLTLSFHDQQQRLQLHQSQQQQQQKQQGSQLSLINDGLASQIKQHQEEIHQYLRTQEEQLRRTLAEKRQIHYRQLLTTAEEVMTRKLREKEAEVEKVTRKNAELEARAAQLSVEAQVWQAKARAQEAAAASLQAQLQQTIMCHRGENSGGGVSCAVEEGQAEDAGSAYIDPESERVVEARPKCRGCGKRVASVVVLPCRHLCICTECDGVHLRACPFCLTPKNSTVQVFLS